MSKRTKRFLFTVSMNTIIYCLVILPVFLPDYVTYKNGVHTIQQYTGFYNILADVCIYAWIIFLYVGIDRFTNFIFDYLTTDHE